MKTVIIMFLLLYPFLAYSQVLEDSIVCTSQNLTTSQQFECDVKTYLSSGGIGTSVKNALVNNYKYQVTIDNAEGIEIPNPLSELDFAVQKIMSFISEHAESLIIKTDVSTARESGQVKADLLADKIYSRRRR